MQPKEDYIDFPCSDTFRGFFYERGLTPHPPANRVNDVLIDLVSQLKDLVSEVRVISENIPEGSPRSLQGDASTTWTGNRETKTNQRRIVA